MTNRSDNLPYIMAAQSTANDLSQALVAEWNKSMAAGEFGRVAVTGEVVLAAKHHGKDFRGCFLHALEWLRSRLRR